MFLKIVGNFSLRDDLLILSECCFFIRFVFGFWVLDWVVDICLYF